MSKNAKNQLQEVCQASGTDLPKYTHAKVNMQWVSTVHVMGYTFIGQPYSKKTQADMSAAQIALEEMSAELSSTGTNITTGGRTPSPFVSEALKLNKYQPFELFASDLDMKQTAEIAVFIDFENINSLTELHNLWTYQGKVIPILKFVGQSNCNAETPLSTHVATSSGKDAADHFISTFIGYHIALRQLKKVLVVTRDKFGEHHTRYYQDITHAPEVHYCTSERLCIKLLLQHGCVKTDTVPEYHHDLGQPNSWSYLKHYDGQVISHPFTREPSVEAAYSRAKKDPLQPIKGVMNEVKRELKAFDYTLRSNDYPYYVPGNVLHMVYWHTGSHSRDVARENASVLFNVPVEDIVVFTNSRLVQTIPEIAHHHVFIRTNEEDKDEDNNEE